MSYKGKGKALLRAPGLVVEFYLSVQLQILAKIQSYACQNCRSRRMQGFQSSQQTSMVNTSNPVLSEFNSISIRLLAPFAYRSQLIMVDTWDCDSFHLACASQVFCTYTVWSTTEY